MSHRNSRALLDDAPDEYADGPAYGLSPHGIPVQWRWLLPLAVLAATVAWVAGTTSGFTQGWQRVSLVVIGGVLTAVAAGVPLWAQARTARARADALAAAQSARAAMRVAMEDALDPIASLLVQLETARRGDRTRLRAQAALLCLTTISQLGTMPAPPAVDAPRRLRVCFFRLEPGRPRRLVPQTYAGRVGVPSVTFDETTKAGQLLFRIVDDGWRIVDDTDRQRPAVWWDDEHDYRTWAAGPVPGATGQPVGLITVDAPDPGSLQDLDLPLVRLLARLLALAL